MAYLGLQQGDIILVGFLFEFARSARIGRQFDSPLVRRLLHFFGQLTGGRSPAAQDDQSDRLGHGKLLLHSQHSIPKSLPASIEGIPLGFESTNMGEQPAAQPGRRNENQRKGEAENQ